MFSSGYKGTKLKTNLRLAINRLKLLEKKKTEMAMKSRKEIADFLQQSKLDRARIRVEHIIREDYMVEAMELLELYCDLLLARFGLIETMKYCEEGLVEAVSTLIWAAPRLQTDVQELRVIEEQLILKYGKEFGQQSRTNTNNTVNERLIHKLSPNPPPKILVERYLIEIARNYNVPFEPDPEVMMSEGIPSIDSKEFDNVNSYGGSGGPGGGPVHIGFDGLGGGSGGSGGGGIPLPNIPNVPNVPPSTGTNSYPSAGPGYPPNQVQASRSKTPPPAYHPGTQSEKPPYPPGNDMVYPPPSASVPPYPSGRGPSSNHAGRYPPPNAPGNPSLRPPAPSAPGANSLPDLPTVPSDSLPPPGGAGGNVGGQSAGGEDVDFDDLTRRFEELKKKK